MEVPTYPCIDLNNDFSNVIGIVFNNWSGLKLAVEHGAGGSGVEMKRKMENLVQSSRNILFNNGDYYDLVDEFETVLDEQFCTIVEDNSCEEVSNELLSLFNFWKSGDLSSIITRLNTFKVKESILVPLSRISTRNIPRQVFDDQDDMDDTADGANGKEGERSGDIEMDQESEWTVVGKKKK